MRFCLRAEFFSILICLFNRSYPCIQITVSWNYNTALTHGFRLTSNVNRDRWNTKEPSFVDHATPRAGTGDRQDVHITTREHILNRGVPSPRRIVKFAKRFGIGATAIHIDTGIRPNLLHVWQ